MSKFLNFAEKTIWGTAGLALGLIILFAILHVLKGNGLTGPAAAWVGAHAQNY